ncbi:MULTISPECIES: endonuclease/exonuclease/phosphatase family protein [Winogradskyella]|uniref:endonuclease/exonuclease/phosphatase family protein n=1 Tax=Winogradskyella TaxID=286104 RepID=UPI0015CE2B77|nr:MULTISPECIES: endonuclease/exonuclease/phosphatase family protein [Winogradskyella]QNK76997.1 endonuclease/exonuclease/phosphatase family protein [Winogradskyella sp. PAMC22761]QXP80433.1 endonuclease/exonuclease/phosphatase family protein [Winogradskyella sp. HaHa_3_26]
MKSLRFKFIAILLLVSVSISAQEKKKYKIHTVAFYNLENLFDTINDTTIYDEASPMMELNESLRGEAYKKKLHNMAKVIADIGYDDTHNSPAVIGVSEVENLQVLMDLVNDPQLLDKDYGIVHFDSPDKRGIDVALLYQKALFKPLETSSHELLIYDDSTRKRVFTRDQLLVSGELEGDLIHIIVNHWPSRSGGEARSRFKRVAAGKLNKQIIDSLQANDPYAKIMTMGDFNDNPTNDSMKKAIKTEADKEDVKLKGVYNPFENLYKKQGLGTTGYRDAWSLFDMILFTQPLLEKDYSSYRFYKAGIFNKSYLTNKEGRYKDYPLRMKNAGLSGGYSDHFPVYIYLIKEDNKK